MPSLPTLYGPRILLRAPRPGDEADRLHCGRDADFVRGVGGDPRDLRQLTAEDAAGWLAHYSAEPYGWMIVLEGRCIGTARLHPLDEANRRARYAIGLFDATARSQGYGTEATRLVLRYAFEELCLHRVDLRVLAHNARAIACYAKCGFQREGVEREGAFIADEWQTDVMMSILEHEYRALAPQWFAVSDQGRGDGP